MLSCSNTLPSTTSSSLPHDMKDFGGDLGHTIEHAGLVIYTDPVFLRDSPAKAVHTLERVLTPHTADELIGSRVWLDQCRKR